MLEKGYRFHFKLVQWIEVQSTGVLLLGFPRRCLEHKTEKGVHGHFHRLRTYIDDIK